MAPVRPCGSARAAALDGARARRGATRRQGACRVGERSGAAMTRIQRMVGHGGCHPACSARMRGGERDVRTHAKSGGGDKGRSVDKELKQVKKLLKDAEKQLRVVVEKHEKEIAKAKQPGPLDADLAEYVQGMKLERERWEQMFEEERGARAEFLSEFRACLDLARSPASPSEAPRREPAPGAASATDGDGSRDIVSSGSVNGEEIFPSVSQDIFDAISKVGFPDNYKNDASTFRTDADAGHPHLEADAEASTDANANGESGDASSETGLVRLPSSLTVGCDDIVWMSRLHSCLESHGCYPSDEDREDWYFGESTQTAVMAFQCTHGLPEDGAVKLQDWKILLRNDPNYDYNPTSASTSTSTSTSASTSASSSSGDGHGGGAVKLQEGDGGAAVRRLHVALSTQGFSVTSDEGEFWFFGASTTLALKTFQACNGLPESGVACEATWAALGAAAEEGTGQDGSDGYDVDRAREGVFLVGEGRYENAHMRGNATSE